MKRTPVVKTKVDAATTEVVVFVIATGEELGRFYSLHLARKMVSTINRNCGK